MEAHLHGARVHLRLGHGPVGHGRVCVAVLVHVCEEIRHVESDPSRADHSHRLARGVSVCECVCVYVCVFVWMGACACV